MSTSQEYIAFVCDQIRGTGDIRARKMFGEYMVYINGKPVLLVCDNTVFVKKLPCIAALMSNTESAAPYSGAKEHYILDIENSRFSREIVCILEKHIPVPLPKKQKITKPS